MRKQDESILKKWKYGFWILLAEVILIGLGAVKSLATEHYVEDFSDGTSMPIWGMSVPLEKGYYIMDIYYTTDGSIAGCQTVTDLSYGRVYGETIYLTPYKDHVTAEFELRESTECFFLYVENWEQVPFDINGMLIRQSRRGDMKNLFLLACLFLVVDICIIAWKRKFFQNMGTERRQVWLGLCGICLIASFPVFLTYLTVTGDTYFHLMRIEGLAEELRNGVFPVKMQTAWMNGYGYATSVMYGDLLLYIPAVLRLIGFTLQDAYHIYMFLINAVTAITSYYCVKVMTGSSKIGLMGSLLYTWSQYRLLNMYLRNAAGEFTAMAFLPLVFAGLYLLLETQEKRKGCVCMAFGYTMILQSHPLSFEMVILFSALYCLINIKKLLANIEILLSTAGVTIMLNLGFLVPFADYMLTQDMRIKEEISTGVHLQEHGLFISQLFSGFAFAVGDRSASVSEGINNDTLLTLGLPFLVVLAIWVWYAVTHNIKIKETMGIDSWREQSRVFILLCIALWMCCYFFPWTVVGKIPVVGKYLTVYQFAWRFLTIATIMGTILSGYALKNLGQISGKQIQLAAAAVIGAISLVCATNLTNYILGTMSQDVIVSKARLVDDYVMSGKEYLPSGTDESQCYITAAAGDSVSVESLIKEDNDYIVTCSNPSGELSWVEVPRLMYKGYIAEDTQTEERFEIAAGDNNKIRIALPAGYGGSIRVRFQQPRLWVAAELVAAVTGAIVTIWLFLTRKRER